MASSAKFFFLLFLLTLLSSLQIHARDPQLFNKIPSNNAAKETQVVVPNSENTLNNKQEQEPNFIPEDENGGYGLYGHESGQLPPSTPTTNPNGVEPFKTTTTTTTTNLPYNSQPKESYPKYLPKNYNTHAYVTEPEGYRSGNNYNNFYNGENTYYNNEQESLGETKLLGDSYTNNPSNYRNNYYNNEEQQGMSDTRYNNYNKNNNYYNNYNGVNTMNGGVQKKQGMSDTRFLENGKYYYDIKMEPNFNHGPYGANNRGYYGNNYNENSFEHSNNYQNQEQFQNFQDEQDLP